MRFLYAVLTFVPAISFANPCAKTGTGSCGDFSPKAFIEAAPTWKVYRFQGSQSNSGFPCDSMGNSCRREKSYTIQSVRAQHRTTSIDIGIGSLIGDVTRFEGGTQRKIEIKSANNLIIARIDGTRASSRFGFDASSADTITRMIGNGLYGQGTELGYIERKDAAWALLNPFSYYYRADDQTLFGLTVLDKSTRAEKIQNLLGASPLKRRIREGTLWCASDQWGGIDSILRNDEFNVEACQGTALLQSKTNFDLSNVTSTAQGWFLNRQDSTVTNLKSRVSYEVETRTEWICLVDCDGSTYEIKNNKGDKPMVHISSDRWNWMSRNGFKIKVVAWDRDSDGLPHLNKNVTLDDLAQKPALYKDIVAVIITEISSPRTDIFGNGQWSFFTYLMFPPGNEIENIQMLDGILTMMPEQTPSSPELADAEEKLDDLRAFLRLQGVGGGEKGSPEQISADLMMDIYSPIDATTAVTWRPPHLAGEDRKGKIDRTLEKLNSKR